MDRKLISRALISRMPANWRMIPSRVRAGVVAGVREAYDNTGLLRVEPRRGKRGRQPGGLQRDLNLAEARKSDPISSTNSSRPSFR